MTHAAFESKLKSVISEVLGIPVDHIGPGFQTSDHPSWSSLQQLMLVSELERQFSITFTNAEVPQLTSYDRLCDALGRRLNGT
jgi:acyl carrier protein